MSLPANSSPTKWVPWALGGMMVLYLIPIWMGMYFLTGDGPCHLYNSRVLLDYLKGQHLDLYQAWYQVNPAPEPNWFSHASLMLLLAIFPPFLAEKMLLSLYVIVYPLALRGVLKAIHPQAGYLVFLGFPFIYQYTFQMGFYNYSFSILFFFFLLQYWWKYHENLTPIRILGLGGLLLLEYFTHPVGFFYSIAGIGFHWLSRIREKAFSVSVGQLGKVVLAALPALILLLNYFFRKGGVRPEAGTESMFSLGYNFGKFSSLILLIEEERFISISIGAIILSLGFYAVFRRIKYHEGKKGDPFWPLILIALLTYFGNIGGLAGAGVLSVRLQFLPYLMMLLWVAAFPLREKWRKYIMIAGIVLGSGLLVMRMPAYLRTQEALDEYLSVADFIEPGHTVLPLSYDHRGRTPKGEEVANRIWLFFHIADYLAVDKPLIMLDNYEANTGYFPLKWLPDQNPYIHLPVGEGIEGRPPGVDLSQLSVDYVLTWCEDFQYKDHPRTHALHDQLSELGYQHLGESSQGLVQVYRKRREATFFRDSLLTSYTIQERK